MKLIEFGFRHTFYDWFWRGDRSDNYPLITRYCYNEFSHRLMDSIKKLGLENE